MSDQNIALLVIHVQMAFFQAPKPLYRADSLVANIKDLISKAHRADIPVIYIQENATGELEWMNTTPLWNIHPELVPTSSDIVLQQSESDIFADGSLGRELELELRNIHRLIVTGLQTEYCINTTCRNGAALGYDMTLISDGHSCFDSDTASAQQIIAQYTKDLSTVASVKLAQEMYF